MHRYDRKQLPRRDRRTILHLRCHPLPCQAGGPFDHREDLIPKSRVRNICTPGSAGAGVFHLPPYPTPLLSVRRALLDGRYPFTVPRIE